MERNESERDELLIQIARAFEKYQDAEADLSDAKINVALAESRSSITVAISWVRWIFFGKFKPSPLSRLRAAHSRRNLALERHITADSEVLHLLSPNLHHSWAENCSPVKSSPYMIQ